MRIARIFDLLDADNRSTQLETELKQASAIWGSPTEDVFAMMVWLKMLAERGHYTSLIEGARRLFMHELESVETIENAYRALPPAFILEPLHSQGLRSCRDTRLNLVAAIKAINQQYQRNQDYVSKDAEDRHDEAAEGRQSSQFQDMHTAFLEFYGDMDEIEIQVLKLREVARSSAAELSPILEQAKGQLEEQHAHRIQLRRKIAGIRRAITRKKSERADDTRSAQWIHLENEQNQKQVRRLEEEFKEQKRMLKEKDEEIRRQDLEMKQNELIVSRLKLGEEELTMQQIASKHEVTQQSVSKRILRLIKEGLLDGVGREGRKHKIFNSREVAVITTNWPSARTRRS